MQDFQIYENCINIKTNSVKRSSGSFSNFIRKPSANKYEDTKKTQDDVAACYRFLQGYEVHERLEKGKKFTIAKLIENKSSAFEKYGPK